MAYRRCGNFSLCEDTCRTHTGRLPPALRPTTGMPDVPASVTSHTRLFTLSINKTQRKCHHFGVANRNFLPSCCRYPHHPSCHQNGGGERDRTDDLLLAKQALSQLSYTPASEGTSVI